MPNTVPSPLIARRRKGQSGKLLAVGPGGLSTGFGRVFRHILGHLCGAMEVVHFSPNLIEDAVDSPYSVLPRQIRGDIFGREALPQILTEYDPDFVLFCHDPPFWSVHRETLATHKLVTGRRPFCAFYCPIEWSDIHPEILQGMSDLDALVLYTRFGLDVVEYAFADGRKTMPPTHVIPHGVDTREFHPMFGGCRAEVRRRLWPDRPELEDAFIVLNANRNCPRKRIDLTMEAFAQFSRRKSDAYLYLHTGMQDSGIDIMSCARRLGICDRLLVTHEERCQPKLTNAQLNLIYNACDVGINTSTGEGWGLVAFEHAAAGAPQIVPNHSACRENWLGRGEMIPLCDGDITVEDTAEAIERLYRKPDLRRLLSKVGAEYVREERFDWERIGEQWLDLFQSVH